MNHCVPAHADVGDLNCDDFYAQGTAMIQLADPYNDPHRLDGWYGIGDGWSSTSDGYEPGHHGHSADELLTIASMIGAPAQTVR